MSRETQLHIPCLCEQLAVALIAELRTRIANLTTWLRVVERNPMIPKKAVVVATQNVVVVATMATGTIILITVNIMAIFSLADIVLDGADGAIMEGTNEMVATRY